MGIDNLSMAENYFDNISGINGFEYALIQETAIGDEIIIGLKNTNEFGAVIMAGAGGSEAEKINDISFRACPISQKDAFEMLKELNIYKKIKGKKAEKVIECLLNLSEIAEEEKINELDINPLVVNEKEAVVVDARIELFR